MGMRLGEPSRQQYGFGLLNRQLAELYALAVEPGPAYMRESSGNLIRS